MFPVKEKIEGSKRINVLAITASWSSEGQRFTPIYDHLELYDCVSLVKLLSPGHLRISEEWYTRFKVTWDPPQSPPMGYRIVYQPIYGTHTSRILILFLTWEMWIWKKKFSLFIQELLFLFFIFICLFLLLFTSAAHLISSSLSGSSRLLCFS